MQSVCVVWKDSMDAKMGGWMDGWMDGWTDRQTDSVHIYSKIGAYD